MTMGDQPHDHGGLLHTGRMDINKMCLGTLLSGALKYAFQLGISRLIKCAKYKDIPDGYIALKTR